MRSFQLMLALVHPTNHHRVCIVRGGTPDKPGIVRWFHRLSVDHLYGFYSLLIKCFKGCATL